MNSAERQLLDKLDNLVLNASSDDLQRIQDLDIETQLSGFSFYDSFLNSKTLINQIIRKESKDFLK